jgi:hypothetical protein
MTTDTAETITAVEKFEEMKQLRCQACNFPVCADDYPLCSDCEREKRHRAAQEAYWERYEPENAQYLHLRLEHPPLVSLGEQEEWDDEYHCHVSPEGPGTRCYQEATRMIFEPFTPRQFPIKCCDAHAESLISQGQGYLRKRG